MSTDPVRDVSEPDPELAALWLSELWQPVREYHPGRTFRRRRHPADDAPGPAPHVTRY